MGRGCPIARAQIKGISLSGVGIEQSASESDAPIGVDQPVAVFIAEVGFIAGIVVRQSGQVLAVRFELPASVERDLLIRKLLTAGYDTKNVSTSAWSASRAMLKSIWGMRTDMQQDGVSTPDAPAAPSSEKLPARSLVVPPQPQPVRLSDLVEKRRALAA